MGKATFKKLEYYAIHDLARFKKFDKLVFTLGYPKPKRMTHRQLAMWLAKGNGECSYNNTVYYLSAYGYHCYDMRHANDFVDEHIRVRKWDSEEWIEPTVDLLEDC